jgi:hypothetical protein
MKYIIYVGVSLFHVQNLASLPYKQPSAGPELKP